MPPTEICRICARTDHHAAIVVDPDIRKSVYARFMKGAQRVFAPSEDTARRIRSVFSDQSVVVRPHAEKLLSMPAPATVRSSRPLVVVLVGAINQAKGSNLLHALALDALERSLDISYHIVGYSDVPSMLSHVGVIETGEYVNDVDALAQILKIQPHLCFMSSVWPETYSYALSLMLTAGVPVVTFDIGAQAERLTNAGCGTFLPISLVNDPASINDRLLALDIDSLRRHLRVPKFANYNNLVEDYYELE
jgi:glycosyltransferase involved in cell wall biosynthesis